MKILGKVFHTLRVWMGLADASESHLTPSHGWLLTTPAEARQQRELFAADQAARLRRASGRS
jgi:hypothetical protein